MCPKNRDEFEVPATRKVAAVNQRRKSVISNEAREGLERAWLAILRARHPEYEWVIVKTTRKYSQSGSARQQQQQQQR
jgi:hypothetical protein